MNHLKEIQELLKPLPHKLKVRFALDCALDVKHLMGPEAVQVLDVVGKWLKGEVAQAEVADAADYATIHASPAYNAASHASYAAVNAAGKNKDKKIKEYYENLKGMILNMSELEKLVYECD